ncbi:MAG: hypothetical protein HY272_06420 [Gammaproteobacteria bacterium]|nr:hypothetical protein [Gammaproteobacteria bacterium]
MPQRSQATAPAVWPSCNQVRSFNLETRERAGTVRYVETLDAAIAEEITSRVIQSH